MKVRQRQVSLAMSTVENGIRLSSRHGEGRRTDGYIHDCHQYEIGCFWPSLSLSCKRIIPLSGGQHPYLAPRTKTITTLGNSGKNRGYAERLIASNLLGPPSTSKPHHLFIRILPHFQAMLESGRNTCSGALSFKEVRNDSFSLYSRSVGCENGRQPFSSRLKHMRQVQVCSKNVEAPFGTGQEYDTALAIGHRSYISHG